MMVNNKKSKLSILTIAANDSAGMAGVAVDIKVQQAFGIHSLVAMTANTAQNNHHVISINAVDANILKEQLNVLKDFTIKAVKVGLVCNLEQVKVIAEFIRLTKLPLILDPVFTSTSGYDFFKVKEIAIYADTLLPLCTLITPNYNEVSALTGLPVSTTEDVELVVESLLALGVKNVLVKGGHANNHLCQDYFASHHKNFWLSSPRKTANNNRGTGCALASAIASSVVLGYSIEDAIVIGKMTINQGLRESYAVGEQKGPVSIDRFPDQGVDLPYLTCSSQVSFQDKKFPECNQIKLGLYPVVDRSEWLHKLLPTGVSTIQLRIKDLKNEALELEIKNAIAIAQLFNCRLFINDYWQLAIKHGAYGVHLGQEDLDEADIDAIYQAGLRLGISTHCHYEVARAICYQPSYIACGPVYHTHTKQMPWVPQGVDGLNYWRTVLDYPMVAIGGINQDKIKAVVNTGVDSVAMITAITQADEPELICKQLLVEINVPVK